MIRAVVTLAAVWAAGSALLVVAVCSVRARDNARVRAVRREMRAEVIERLRVDREFDAIVAASYARKDHA